MLEKPDLWKPPSCPMIPTDALECLLLESLALVKPELAV